MFFLNIEFWAFFFEFGSILRSSGAPAPSKNLPKIVQEAHLFSKAICFRFFAVFDRFCEILETKMGNKIDVLQYVFSNAFWHPILFDFLSVPKLMLFGGGHGRGSGRGHGRSHSRTRSHSMFFNTGSTSSKYRPC